jgi:potassium-transporting ATPase KdpC subunit
MSKLIRPALTLFAVFTLLTGFAYPAVITGVAEALFPWQANGSLIRSGDKIIGSKLIGQPFDDPALFWSRPSATTPTPYNAGSSSGSNLGPLNPALLDAVAQRVKALRAADSGNRAPVPIDLVTASASGLDPDISPAAAYYQVPRIARLRGLSQARVRRLIDAQVQGRMLGVLGEPHVNVLELNWGLIRLAPGQ